MKFRRSKPRKEKSRGPGRAISKGFPGSAAIVISDAGRHEKGAREPFSLVPKCNTRIELNPHGGVRVIPE